MRKLHESPLNTKLRFYGLGNGPVLLRMGVFALKFQLANVLNELDYVWSTLIPDIAMQCVW